MEQQKEFTVPEQSKLQEDNNKSTLIKYEEVKGTPFTLVEKDNDVLITIGNLVCDPNVFANKTEAKKHINKKIMVINRNDSDDTSRENFRTKIKQGVKIWQSKET